MKGKYIGRIVTTHTYATRTVVIDAEIPNSLPLSPFTGREKDPLHANIKLLSSCQFSLMPLCHEIALPPRTMADVLIYLHGK